MSEHQLITPRRNFLIRALGFTAAGAAVPIPVLTLADAKSRMEHHRAELEKAWRDYYGPENDVRIHYDASPVGTITPASVDHDSRRFKPHTALSMFMICAGGSHLQA
ncbi:hypothetical protein V5279_23835 [Bradyrhizobium sp. 26S5]|uniref:hypothetical protein n=1 Tax=Bradyrhizobium sp. 26S5 TaxID=3139729 RepID=UPI0030CFADFC